MEINVELLPKIGDYVAYKVIVLSSGQTQFTVVGKLTGTELASSLAKKCIKTNEEAHERLKQFTLQEAKKIYNNGNYQLNTRIELLYSPCW